MGRTRSISDVLKIHRLGGSGVETHRVMALYPIAIAAGTNGE